MMHARHGTHWVILSFLFALVLTVLPLPTFLNQARPAFVVLTLIYWVLALPHRYGIFAAFAVGLALDVITGKMLGLHALLLSVLAYVCVKQYSRVRMFTRPMQAAFVLLLVGLSLLLQLWIENAVQPVSIRASYWLPALSSGLLWFLWFPLLRGLRRRLQIS
ncbi:rod shape-determining protein MreD [Permianibacter sp. IMCC34836]|uniref:rod shape-determining protein MreD n=1 Tax=Permianibacter fluminis TaxID=2738515 RepID=UPI001557FB3B|nr:rod shape-determining protein MreD [Permianibacter fluminis]NQD39008.1 rod shape-determining protein MreD [Permianibacter fluminis]